MTMVISGSGTITGLSAGGLPDASITQAEIGTNVAGNGPAFSAYATSGTVLANSTFVKITFDTENFDTNSNYASSRFTPTVAGYYQVTACVLTTNSAIGCSGLVFYKNGAAFAYGSQSQNTTGTTNVGGSALIYCNGSTDYIEVYVVQTTGSSITTVVGASHFNVFSGSLVRAA